MSTIMARMMAAGMIQASVHVHTWASVRVGYRVSTPPVSWPVTPGHASRLASLVSDATVGGITPSANASI